MRNLLFAGVSALALATPAGAQQAGQSPADDSQLDTLVPADEPSEAEAPKPTGDAVLDRLNTLEARVKQLEARNAVLEQQAELNEGRIETVETRAAKNAQFGWAPTISDPAGD